MWLRAGFAMGVLAVTGWASAPVGIPRELATERAAAISDIRYTLRFTIWPQPNAHTVPGSEELSFNLSKDGPLLLDFRGENARNLMLNGRSTPVVTENDHIVLPATSLERGANLLSLEFDAPVGTAGQAITRYEDKEDGSVYFYTLFVPMDASAAFPCFDQPDLKARFTVNIIRRNGDIVIANAKHKLEDGMGLFALDTFEETEPISTYLVAFAVGPFQSVHHQDGMPDVYVRHSQVARAQSEIPAVQQVTADGIKFLSGYFDQPFPFSKYDMVLIPGFPFGGMWSTRVQRSSMKTACCFAARPRKTTVSAAILSCSTNSLTNGSAT